MYTCGTESHCTIARHIAKDIIVNKAASISIQEKTDIMGSCGSKQKKDEAVAGAGSSGRAGSASSSSKPNQKANKLVAEGRNDQDDIDAVRYLRKQKESPTKVRRGTD